ncbi:MAG: AAA family ATPase [Bacteroidia bacterium]
MQQTKTIKELKKTGYISKTIKQELRDNLIEALKSGKSVFENIHGYQESVIPDIERAILSSHNINLLGLRGQAKTRIARSMVNLLDEWMPIVAGSEINDDPFHPISHFAKQKIKELGDETPIDWIHRNDRFVEKLATPDVSVADLIGDIDPVKAFNLKLSHSDEQVIHFGIVPRSNRCIFVINELPDLQPRIQVSLFNILQEGDIQIRGFKLRLPLDIQFVFTANPEDYTNRGSIITPLKDRIGSQILTHYPKTIEIAKTITRQEAKLSDSQKKMVKIPDLVLDLIEQIVVEARKSEYVDAKSGVSARLSISAFENLVSTAERRAILTGDKTTSVRISDFEGVIPAITGKVEMVYEGEQEGPYNVAQTLIGKAIRTLFDKYCPPIEKLKKKGQETTNLYKHITNWFERGNDLEILSQSSDKNYMQALNKVDNLASFFDDHLRDVLQIEKYLWMEFILFGLAEHSKLSRNSLNSGVQFKDLVGSMFEGLS